MKRYLFRSLTSITFTKYWTTKKVPSIFSITLFQLPSPPSLFSTKLIENVKQNEVIIFLDFFTRFLQDNWKNIYAIILNFKFIISTAKNGKTLRSIQIIKYQTDQNFNSFLGASCENQENIIAIFSWCDIAMFNELFWWRNLFC